MTGWPPAICWQLTIEDALIAFAAMQDRKDDYRQRDAWMLANLLQPWSKQRLRAQDFYVPETPTSGLSKAQKTEELLRRLEAQGQLAPEGDNA